MDIRKIIIFEFKSVFERHGYTASEDILRVAESPFNLEAVQLAVDSDMQKLNNEVLSHAPSERIRLVRNRERYHNRRLRNLARQYAILLLLYKDKGMQINESIASNGQAYLKELAGRGCDVYPCVRQQLGVSDD